MERQEAAGGSSEAAKPRAAMVTANPPAPATVLALARRFGDDSRLKALASAMALASPSDAAREASDDTVLSTAPPSLSAVVSDELLDDETIAETFGPQPAIKRIMSRRMSRASVGRESSRQSTASAAGVPEEPRGTDTRGTVPSDTGRVVVWLKGRARRGQGAPSGAQRFVRPG